MKNLYVIAGCNGAGKTTASYTILPEILDCKEFVNADEIAKGLSPFQPETANFLAGRLMLTRINEFIEDGVDFAFETTLTTKSYVSFLEKAKAKGYKITMLFFWLNSKELAVERVASRVKEGGHNIPKDVILRRYERGISNFFNIFRFNVDNWILINNSTEPFKIITEHFDNTNVVEDEITWKELLKKYSDENN